MSHLDDLRLAVSSGNAVFVVGTGASKALSGNAAEADWVGLIRHGIARAAQISGDSAWESYANSSLAYAISSNDVAALISAASSLQQKLNAVGATAYATWLEDTVGALEMTDPTLGLALADTGCPILTTNYDELLEKATSRPSTVWHRAEQIRDTLRNEPPGIGHLHGSWREPDSVVLSEADYARVLGDAPAQHLQSAYYATKVFVFVGYGSGLSDPNFGWVLRTHRKLFPEARHHHYRLVSDGDVDATAREHADSNIRTLGFGPGHSDLPGFIRSLVPKGEGGSPRHDYVSFAREAILEQLRDDTVIADDSAAVSTDTALDELVVAPVLLPMPHEKFAASQHTEGDAKPRVLNAIDVYSASKLFVVAGEEGSGVTTALRWLAFQASESRLGVAPLFIDARRCRGVSHALDKEVRQEALTRRLIDEKKQALPDHILAIDNLVPASTSAFRSLIEDLNRSSGRPVFVGTRQGNEAELVDLLSESAIPIEVIYLGKPGRAQVQALAAIIAPESHSGLIDQVLDVLRREHLQRTPFNICLLLMLLSKGAGSMLNASDTAVLDKYVQLLTGRSGSFLDPRWTLDPQNREAVLSDLARRMVRERRGSMTRGEVVIHFESYFKTVDWSEDALETLNSLIKMRVLRSQGESVSFQQTSYLHLFAAKAAIDDPQFLAEVLLDPLYFAPLIRHYAALVRNSEHVASQLLSALRESWPSAPPTGPVYSPMKLRTAPAELTSSAGGISDHSPDPGEQDGNSADEAEDGYDWSDDRDARPFPLDDPREWPLPAQLMWALDLASRVVRDSDQIKNLDLKDELFSVVLDRWGFLLDVVSQDPALRELADTIVDSVDGSLTPEQIEERKEEMMTQIPPFVVLAGINATLASRKLLLPLERVNSKGHPSPVYFDLAAAVLAISINVPGWAARLPDIARKYGSMNVVGKFLLPLVSFSYRYQTLAPEDERDLEQFMKLELPQLHEWTVKREQDAWVGERFQEIRKRRALGRTQRLPEGESALDALDEDLN